MDEIVLRVERVGARGDGIAIHEGERVYLPLTAPGDIVRARLSERRGDGRSARILAYEAQAPRAEPACPHFGLCGGCSLQHLVRDDYVAIKTEWLAAALRRGVAAGTVLPLRLLPPGTRRRARFALARPRDAAAPAELGFHARATHRIVDLAACAVLLPALAALVPALRTLARDLLGPGDAGAATATVADTGIDLLLDLPRRPQLAALEAMAAFARAHDLARLAWRAGSAAPAPVAVLRPVRVGLAGVAVDLPYDAFLQASADADRALQDWVTQAAAGAERIADLFAGVGTLTFALAALAPVHAVEGDDAALAALGAAASRAGLRVTTERRDLERRPLTSGELERFDTVIFDPPRAGARAQSEALARSAVRRVIAVSCNPATFARDASALAAGGFRLGAIAPIDSFAWSAHLELAASFER